MAVLLEFQKSHFLFSSLISPTLHLSLTLPNTITTVLSAAITTVYSTLAWCDTTGSWQTAKTWSQVPLWSSPKLPITPIQSWAPMEILSQIHPSVVPKKPQSWITILVPWQAFLSRKNLWILPICWMSFFLPLAIWKRSPLRPYFSLIFAPKTGSRSNV